MLVCALSLLGHACFEGDEREKEPRPGLPGGKCLAPDGRCDAGECNRQRNYCYDPTDPCAGFFCGGVERGLCTVTTDLLPQCVCRPGFNNQQWSHYCCPDGASDDPYCMPLVDPSGGETGSLPEVTTSGGGATETTAPGSTTAGASTGASSTTTF